MVVRNILLVVLVFCAFNNYVDGQTGCVAQTVENITIHTTGILTWEVAPNETCQITSFHLNVRGTFGNIYHVITQPFVFMDWFNTCDDFTTTISAMSFTTRGYPRTATGVIPLPSDTDLTMKYLNVTQSEGRDVLLEWDLSNHTKGDCTLEYQISILDEELDIQEDIYVRGNSHELDILSPCVSYQFGIRAINRAFPTVEGPVLLTELEMPAQRQSAPVLSEVTAGSTTINMVWTLEGDANRCPLKELHIDAGNHFNISVSLLNVEDSESVSVELKSLQPNSMYFMKVSVENYGGVSSPAQIAVQTLE